MTRRVARALNRAVLVTCSGALTALVAGAQQPPATFFDNGGKREQCGSLQAWIDSIERTNSGVNLMNVQTQNLPSYMVVGFRDTVFVRYFGAPYASLDADKKKRIAGRMRSCTLASWVPYALLGAFDDKEQSSAAFSKLLAADVARRQFVPSTVQPKPVHNAFHLLKQTPLADIYLGSRVGRTWLPSDSQFCASSADAVLVFKVGPDYRIMNAPEYWAFVEQEVLPAVFAACRKKSVVVLENYVKGYRLLLRGAKVVYAPGDTWPNDVSLDEEPLSQGSIDPTVTPVTRRFATGSPRLLPRGSQGGSINDVLANGARLLAESEAESSAAQARQAQEAAALEARTHWTYRLGEGFLVSDWLRAREADARAVLGRTDPLALTMSALQVMAGTANQRNGALSPVEALSTIDFRNRREAAERVLATLATPGPVRFTTQAIGGSSLETVMQMIFDGRFPTPGRVTPLPDVNAANLDSLFVKVLAGTTSEQADATYHQRIFKLYHAAYAARCRADESLPWETVHYPGEELVTTVGLEKTVVDRQQLVEPAQQDVRQPYASVVKRYHPNKDRMDLGRSPSGEPRASNMAITQALHRFLQSHGCSSRATRQFEVNLYLLAEGFPSAQEIIGRGRGTR